MPAPPPPRPPHRPDGSGRSLPALAHLLAADGRIVGGIARRDEDYALVLAGKVMAATDSAGMAIAMLRHARVLLSKNDVALRMRVSPELETPAVAEAALAGLELEPYLDVLESERRERAEERGASRQ
jgi:hypothetical protein